MSEVLTSTRRHIEAVGETVTLARKFKAGDIDPQTGSVPGSTGGDTIGFLTAPSNTDLANPRVKQDDYFCHISGDAYDPIPAEGDRMTVDGQTYAIEGIRKLRAHGILVRMILHLRG